MIAAALAYLRALEAAALPLEQARDMIFFRLAADADQFLTIAKFRALRKLWARIEEACRLCAHAGLRHGRDRVADDDAARSAREHVARDHRGVCRRPSAAPTPSACCRSPPRSACPMSLRGGSRATSSSFCAMNSNLARVADAAAGSGAVENLTDQLCSAAWALFQEIDTAGGAAAALESGMIQSKVAAVRAKRQAAIASAQGCADRRQHFSRTRRSTGRSPGTRRHRIHPCQSGRRTSHLRRLSPIRLAEPFEALRDASDKILAAFGARPRIFLASLGTVAEFSAARDFRDEFLCSRRH